nr:uncharacterized mitochondrial protein AtMg00310-like [Ipomoea batatas]
MPSFNSIEGMMNKYWWQSNHTGGGVRWLSWNRITVPKSEGRGFKILNKFNIDLLAKQGWRLLANPMSIVSGLYQARYFNGKTFLEANRELILAIVGVRSLQGRMCLHKVVSSNRRWSYYKDSIDKRTTAFISSSWLSGVGIDLHYPLCCGALETLKILFLECLEVVEVWRGIIDPTLHVNEYFEGWLSNLFMQTDSTKFMRCVAMCWSIWKRRNDWVWSRKVWSGEGFKRIGRALELRELVIGGDGTQKGAAAIFKEVTERGLTVAVAGIPKTIDNDIAVSAEAMMVLAKLLIMMIIYNQAENAISFTDSASNDIIWFQCRHVIKGLASRTST